MIEAVAETRWSLIPLLGVLAVVHYVLEACALRSAAGIHLPFGRTTLVQFTSAAVARITPGGVGGIAVNARYLTVNGLAAPASLTAATACAGGLVVGRVVVLLATVAATGDVRVLQRLIDRFADVSAHEAARKAAAVLIPGALLVVIIVVALRRARRAERARRSLRESWDALRAIAARPASLLGLLLSSVGVALVLAVAFGLAVLAVPGTGTTFDQLGVLIGAYLVGSAAGAAVPVPGGVGTAEAALTGTLVLLGIGTLPALQAVLVFRLITYWAPVPIGVLASRFALAR
ncbi:flippase-like domain-containing protein [Actinocorallia sp. API 0066]|uniref:lysylphosphatidylglycerol synthase transmembrane domain-containing protein n=1 Tax=Actinocorallia sp. API 0066 TaxID=2896846 RepID=UPI001E513324|nr:flippase-like domain-containing protein [Actinocorallia sp. API 0066]MCD0448744.1 flippase-like domain-containing protein [Actinocorallia sp. API 0066]